MYNTHDAAARDEAFNFYLALLSGVELRADLILPMSVWLTAYNHTTLYVFAYRITISKHTRKVLFPPQRASNCIECRTK